MVAVDDDSEPDEDEEPGLGFSSGYQQCMADMMKYMTKLKGKTTSSAWPT